MEDIKVFVNSGGLPVSLDLSKSCHWCKHVKPIPDYGNHPLCGNPESEFFEMDVRSINTCKLWEAKE